MRRCECGDSSPCDLLRRFRVDVKHVLIKRRKVSHSSRSTQMRFLPRIAPVTSVEERSWLGGWLREVEDFFGIRFDDLTDWFAIGKAEDGDVLQNMMRNGNRTFIVLVFGNAFHFPMLRQRRPKELGRQSPPMEIQRLCRSPERCIGSLEHMIDFGR